MANIQDAAAEYYLKKDRNCAESLFLGGCDSLGIDVDDTAARAIGVFGGGLGCGETCGALAGAAAVLGEKLITTYAHDCPQAKEEAARYTKNFIEAFGSARCEDIKSKFFKEEGRCIDLIRAAAKILENQYNEIIK